MNAFETLGLTENAPEDDIRRAYHSLAKQCHPDLFTDSTEQAAAQEKMIQLNLAYREALQRCAGRAEPNHYVVQSPEKAMAMARRYYDLRQYDRALVQLSHITERDAAWYSFQGSVLMGMGQYQSALQAFKICTRMEPDNQEYHAQTLEAAVAVRKHQKIHYRIADWARGFLKK